MTRGVHKLGLLSREQKKMVNIEARHTTKKKAKLTLDLAISQPFRKLNLAITLPPDKPTSRSANTAISQCRDNQHRDTPT